MDVQEIKRHAYGRWLSILPALSPELHLAIERYPRHVPCPVHGGRDGFRLFNDAAESGGGVCNSCGSFPDGISVLQWVNGWTFPETLEVLAHHLGLKDGATLPPVSSPVAQHQSEPRDWTLERKWLASVWEETIAGDGRIEDYLQARGLSIPVPPTLRLHPGLRAKDADGNKLGIFPAMVARFTRGDKLTGLHVTYLDPDEPRKAPIESPRRIWKCTDTISGSAIQLSPCQLGAHLVLAEGVETALAIRELAHKKTVVWACGNASLLECVRLPENVAQVLIAVDRDANRTGQDAGERLAERLVKEGRQVQLAAPPLPIPNGSRGVDWLDHLNAIKGMEVARV